MFAQASSLPTLDPTFPVHKRAAKMGEVLVCNKYQCLCCYLTQAIECIESNHSLLKMGCSPSQGGLEKKVKHRHSDVVGWYIHGETLPSGNQVCFGLVCGHFSAV